MEIKDLIYNTKVLRALNKIDRTLCKNYSLGIDKDLIRRNQIDMNKIKKLEEYVNEYFPPKEKESLLTKIKRFFKR